MLKNGSYFTHYSTFDNNGSSSYQNQNKGYNLNDYYPFGMLMPGRSYEDGNGYRYGFNGKEDESDISGQGNQYDYGDRIYNPRIGRWLSIDKLQTKYPGETPYAFVSGNPIIYNDPDGRDKIIKTYVIENGLKTQIGERVIKGVYTEGQGQDGFFYRSDVIEIVTIDPANKSVSVSSKEGGKRDKFAWSTTRSISTFFKSVGNALNSASSGDGSYQDFGYVVTGNSNGTMEFKDKAGHVLGQIDIGTLLSAFTSAGLSAESIKEAFNSKSAIESIEAFLESYNSFREAGVISAEAIEKTKELFEKKTEVESTNKPTKPDDVVIRKKRGSKWAYSTPDGGAYETPRTDTVKKTGKSGAPDTIVITKIVKTPNPSKKKTK